MFDQSSQQTQRKAIAKKFLRLAGHITPELRKTRQETALDDYQELGS